MSEWRDHSPELVDIREYDDGRPIVVMELQPRDAEVLREAWGELRQSWLELPPHPGIIDAIRRTERSLLLRFAAIDWKCEPLRLGVGPRGDKHAAAWGVQLCHAYTHLARCLTPGRLRRFLCPMPLVDLEGRIRLGFLPPSPHDRVTSRFMAPEVKRDQPVDDENVLVFAIGKVMEELTRPPAAADDGAPPPLVPIIARCVHEDPARRYQTLRELLRAFRHAGPVRAHPHTDEDLATFAVLEETLGWHIVRPPTSERYVSREITRHLPWADRPSPRPEPTPPGSARALYLDGREHLRGGRLADARAAFERALALDPQLIEAMHLRREVDRLARATRDAAGHQYPDRADIDESLARSARLEVQLAHLDRPAA